MIDKVKQIRAEVERLKNENTGSPISVCDDIIAFIDSLQEEPVNIWHDASEEQPNPQKLTLGIFKDRTCPVVGYNSWYDPNAIWCYIDDILPDNK